MYRVLALLLLGCGATPECPTPQPVLGPSVDTDDRMTVNRAASVLRDAGMLESHKENLLQLQVQGVTLVMICDPNADRMRIVAPIGKLAEIGPERLFQSMQANFHTALDARYAMSGDVLHATFIHPLSPLDDRELISGAHQTANLVKTFGTTYSSDALLFGAPQEEPEPADPNAI